MSDAINSGDFDEFDFLIELRNERELNKLYEYPDGEPYTIFDYVLERARAYRINQDVPIIRMYKLLQERGAKTASELVHVPVVAVPRVGRPPLPPKTAKRNGAPPLSNGIAFLKRMPKLRKTRKARKSRKARK